MCVEQSNLIRGTMLNRVITVNLRKKLTFIQTFAVIL